MKLGVAVRGPGSPFRVCDRAEVGSGVKPACGRPPDSKGTVPFLETKALAPIGNGEAGSATASFADVWPGKDGTTGEHFTWGTFAHSNKKVKENHIALGTGRSILVPRSPRSLESGKPGLAAIGSRAWGSLPFGPVFHFRHCAQIPRFGRAPVLHTERNKSHEARSTACQNRTKSGAIPVIKD